MLGELVSPEELAGELMGGLESILGLPVQPLIELLLKQEPEELLEQGLGSTNFSELLAKLLGEAEHPAALLNRLFEMLDPETLEEVIGSTPTGEGVHELNVGELAAALGTTADALAEAVGQTKATLPETAGVVTGLLKDGNELALFDGVEGLALALVAKGTEVIEEGTGGSGAGGGGGGSTGGGGAGGTGGAPGATTVILGSPPTDTQSATSAVPRATLRAGKVRIVSHRVRGRVATLVVQVPGAGKLTVSANGFRAVTREASKAKRLMVHMILSKARSAALHRHHRRLKVRLKASFTAAAGPGSTASATVSLR